MSIELPAVAAAAAVCGFAISFATFWYTFGSRISTAEAEAKAAKSTADVAVTDLKKTDERLSLMSTAFGLYREQVAKEYISREVAREMEDRITTAVSGLGARIDRLVETLAIKATQ